MSDFQAIQHTHLLDIPDYGRCSITVTIGKVSILAAVVVPSHLPITQKTQDLVDEWFTSIIDPIQERSKKPLVVTLNNVVGILVKGDQRKLKQP
jgi:hypothetical protein